MKAPDLVNLGLVTIPPTTEGVPEAGFKLFASTISKFVTVGFVAIIELPSRRLLWSISGTGLSQFSLTTAPILPKQTFMFALGFADINKYLEWNAKPNADIPDVGEGPTNPGDDPKRADENNNGKNPKEVPQEI